MNRLSLTAAACMFVAVPASAEVVHQTSLEHAGATLSVSYEPRTTTRLKQGGIGQKLAATCLWTAETSVERKLLDASGRPLAALSRTLGETKTTEGLRLGYCADLQPAAFQGNADEMRTFLARASEQDRPVLQAELASVAALGRTVSR
jgi:hypothetical protein